MSKPTYTEEILQEAVARSCSFVEVAKNIGSGLGGGSLGHLRNRIKRLGIDTCHFKRTGKRPRQFNSRRKSIEEIFAMRPEGSHREKSHLLRRALQAVGTNEACSVCNITDWQGKKIRLEIDHIDGNSNNCLRENLRFICPNCHSQTETYKSKNKRGNAGEADRICLENRKTA